MKAAPSRRRSTFAPGAPGGPVTKLVEAESRYGLATTTLPKVIRRSRSARYGSGSLSPPPAAGERGLQRVAWFAEFGRLGGGLLTGGGFAVADPGERPVETCG